MEKGSVEYLKEAIRSFVNNAWAVRAGYRVDSIAITSDDSVDEKYVIVKMSRKTR